MQLIYSTEIPLIFIVNPQHIYAFPFQLGRMLKRFLRCSNAPPLPPPVSVTFLEHIFPIFLIVECAKMGEKCVSLIRNYVEKYWQFVRKKISYI